MLIIEYEKKANKSVKKLIDDAISFVETYIIKMSEWCWQTRSKLLRKKQKRK